MNYGMRCHDLCPKTDIDTLVNTIAANHVDQIQLAMGKSIAGYNFDHGHYKGRAVLQMHVCRRRKLRRAKSAWYTVTSF